MKGLAFIAFIAVVTFVRAEDILLPAKLPVYEAFIVRTLQQGPVVPKAEGKIRVTIAFGDGAGVQKHEALEIPRGSSVSDAAGEWRKKNGGLLIGWAQGLVVIRRKVGDQITRLSWSMRQAKTDAPKLEMQNGDVLISLVYSDL